MNDRRRVHRAKFLRMLVSIPTRAPQLYGWRTALYVGDSVARIGYMTDKGVKLSECPRDAEVEHVTITIERTDSLEAL